MKDRLGYGRFGAHGGDWGSTIWKSWKRPPDQLSSHVFVRVLELDFLRHGNAVFREGWAPEFLVQDNVASGRSEGGFHRLGELFHASQQRVTGCFIKLQLFAAIDLSNERLLRF
jgi:hypothetical protein